MTAALRLLLALAAVAIAPRAHALRLPEGGFELRVGPGLGLSPGHLLMLSGRPGASVMIDARLWGPVSVGSYTAWRTIAWVPGTEATGTRNLQEVHETELLQMVGPGFTLVEDGGEVHSLHLLLGVSAFFADNRVVNPDLGLDTRVSWSDVRFEPALLYGSYTPLGERWGWTFRWYVPLLGWPVDAPINMFLEAGLAWSLF